MATHGQDGEGALHLTGPALGRRPRSDPGRGRAQEDHRGAPHRAARL